MWRALLLVALVAGAFAGGWTVRSWKADSTELKTVTKTVYLRSEAAKVNETVAAAAAGRQVEIRWRTKTLIERIPDHVTPEIDRRYPLPGGLVRLYDAAVLGVRPTDLDPAAYGPDDAPSDVEASAAATILTANEGACQADRARLSDLQAWVAAMDTLSREGRAP